LLDFVRHSHGRTGRVTVHNYLTPGWASRFTPNLIRHWDVTAAGQSNMEPINRRQLNNHDLPAEAAVWTYPDRENVN